MVEEAEDDETLIFGRTIGEVKPVARIYESL